MSPRLVLQFLGLPQLHLDDQPVTTDRRKAIALLAYLAVNDLDHGVQKYSRESLSALLWPDYEQAKAFSNLRRTIWEVHQVLGEGWLIAERETVSFNPEADPSTRSTGQSGRRFDLDVLHFQGLIAQSNRQSDPQQRIPLLVEATKLYRNHFLTGFSLKDAYAFNEWAYAQAEELRHKLAAVLERLSDDYPAIGEAEKAVPYARRLVALDPLNEASHRKLMEVYIQAGQHSAALKQYQTCEQILRKELGLDPQPETRALYKKIRKREAKSVPVETQSNTSEPRHNLPSQLSTFIGREQEIEQVVGLLREHRLVTLVGAGGIGKTRLSVQVGRKLLNEYPQGVWFIPLDSLSNPSLVAQTIATTFALHETPDRPILDLLTNFLGEKTTLLILDNCEHVLEACVQSVVTLLTKCPNLRILATSREVLNVTGESVYQMPSLSMPAHNETSLEQLNGYGAVQLFLDRAALALTSFALTNENAQAVIELCRKVDGIPLAIEFAAAQVHMLQVTEILDQLQDSLGFLSTEDRLAASRHQTLQASLDWSWGLLTEAEQKFLRQLAVFAGGWTLESVQEICEGEALGPTRALLKKSLIVADQGSGQAPRSTRYRFHEFVRQYARQKLITSGEEDEVRTRHLNYFLNLSKEIESGLDGPQQMEWFSRANDERDNLRAALEYASKTDLEAGLYISSLLHSFWESFNSGEGARWLAMFIERPESKDFPHAKAKALYTLGVLQIWSQDFKRAASIARECLTLFRACGDKPGEADALLFLGYALQYLDQRTTADDLYEQSLAVARSIGDLRRQALAFFRLGYDRPERQLANWEKALVLFRKAGDRNFAAGLLCLMARFRILLTGDIEKAQKELDEADQLGLLRNQGFGIGGLWGEPGFAKSLIALLSGDYEQADAILQEMVTLAKELGNRMGYLWTRVHLGHVALQAGDLAEARTIFAETAQNFHEDGNTTGVVFSLEGLAGLSVAVGKPERAASLIGWTDATRKQILNPRPFLEQANVDQTVAACLARMTAATFWDAYEEGKRMTLDEAVAYALNKEAIR